jgi:hypothetical protein
VQVPSAAGGLAEEQMRRVSVRVALEATVVEVAERRRALVEEVEVGEGVLSQLLPSVSVICLSTH